MTGSRQKPVANMESLQRLFCLPEGQGSTLGKIDREISENLLGFLRENIVALEKPANELEKSFLDTKIPSDPIYVSDQARFLMDEVVSQSVHTAAPTFIGHMTSALPYFMLPLAKIMIALNQNLVKIETAKAFTPLERQVLGMLHRLIYGRSDRFYNAKTQNPQASLGSLCSDGTVANITALWVALNRLLPANESFHGLNNEGLYRAMNEYPYEDLKILVSQRGHYSLHKAAALLGIGKQNLVSIETDHHQKIRMDLLEAKVQELKKKRVGIVAIVGIAGTTETGNVDPLDKMADLCQREGIYFHVDAAWGGPTLFSRRYGKLLCGIERADSVTIDAHKQLYVPVGAGMVLFQDETSLDLIEHSAQYIIRSGSRDLGRKSLEGSRPGMAMLVHSGLRVIGQKGYELLIDTGIEKALLFGKMIDEHPDFELITEPELNILTYRFVPESLSDDKRRASGLLNKLTIKIQKKQRELGRSFVSRTSLELHHYGKEAVCVFRVVLANPLTQKEHLKDILDEQRVLGYEIFGMMTIPGKSLPL